MDQQTLKVAATEAREWVRDAGEKLDKISGNRDLHPKTLLLRNLKTTSPKPARAVEGGGRVRRLSLSDRGAPA
jgi:hypothetical protein